MSTSIQLQLRKKDYNSNTDTGNGVVVFDNITNEIYVGGQSFSSKVKNGVWDATNKVLTLTKTDGTIITINLKDATSSQQPTSLLGSLRDDVEANKTALSTLNGSGSGSVNQKISTAVSNLSGGISIADKTNDIVTIYTDVDETDGVIDNTGSATIVLAKVASTGSSSDVSVTYNSSTSDMQTAINDIDSRIVSLSSNQLQYIIPSSNATTPNGYYHYYNGNNRYTGTLTASASTMNQIYVCRTTRDGDYHQIMTVKSATGSTYSWIDLSTQSIDLSGYIKSVTVNGQTYTTTSSGTDVTLGDVITAINGETNIASGNSDYVSVVATTDTASSGSKTTTLSSKLKTQAVSTATASADGVALAKDVKDYVNDNLTTIRTWTDSDIPNS